MACHGARGKEWLWLNLAFDLEMSNWLSRRRVALAVVVVAAFLGLSVFLTAGEDPLKTIMIAGSVVEVEPARLVVKGEKGTKIELTTLEDFTKKLAVGSQVTARYFTQGGVNILERLELGRVTSSAPVQSQPVQKRISKVIILPSSAVPDADGLFDAIEKYMESRFGWYVAPHVLGVEIRNRTKGTVATSALEAVDPTTGQFDMTKYLGEREGLVVNVASETRVDSVLEADVEQVMAPVNHRVASWDGVEELIGSKGSRTIAKFSPVADRGQVPASTVVLKLWDSSGRLIWSNRRGLAALAVLPGMGGKLRPRPLSEYLEDSARVERWLTEAFSSLPVGIASNASAATVSK